jgi:hypothetical protein
MNVILILFFVKVYQFLENMGVSYSETERSQVYSIEITFEECCEDMGTNTRVAGDYPRGGVPKRHGLPTTISTPKQQPASFPSGNT